MSDKQFFLSSEQIKCLIEPMGSCYASDKITFDGMQVKFMYRELPIFSGNSGCRFFSGTETQEYIDNENNLMIYDVNTIANYDQTIIPYLQMAIGVELEKITGDSFSLIERDSENYL